MREKKQQQAAPAAEDPGEAQASGDKLRMLAMRHKQKQKKKEKEQQPEKVAFGEDEAEEVEGERSDGDAASVVDDSQTGGQEKESGEEKKKEEPDQMAAEFGNEIPGALEKAGITSKAVRAAMIPHLITLGKASKWKEMLDYLSQSVSPAEAMEIAKAIGDHLGIEISEEVMEAVETADWAIEGIQFQYDAFQALAEAHEAGGQDNRALKYVEAWTLTIMEGPGVQVPTDDPDQQEAVQLGHRDATLTLTLWGARGEEIGRKMLEKYGSKSGVKRALETELCKRAGFKGLQF